MIKLKKKRTDLHQHIIKDDWFKSCSDLILYNFIKLITTQNLDWLVISGTPSKETLREAYNEIQNEYSDLVKDSSSDFVLNLLTQIAYIDEKLRIIYNIVSILEMKRIEGLVGILKNDYGFGYEYSDESMANDLKSTLNEIKEDHITLDLSKIELDEYQKKGKPATEPDYDKLIGRLSKYQGYQIKSKEITVTQFLSILNDYTETNKPKQLVETDE